MRVLLRCLPFLLLAIVLPACGKPSSPVPSPDHPLPSGTREPVVAEEDYAQARRGFKTMLVRTGPSPQPAPKAVNPVGATAVEYPSGPLRLRAYLARPAGEGKHPTVLFLHGGFAFDNDDWEMATPFQDAGFVVMVPLLRGENGQPGHFTLFYDELDDVLAAADFLVEQPGVDPSHLYVAGHSAGGTLTLLAALTTDRFRAAASFSGSVDQRNQDPRWLVFDRTDPREFRLRSPLAFATGFKCPVRIYYGDREAWAKAASRQTAELAKGKGLDVEAVEVPGDHYSSVPEARRRAIAFFRQKS